MIGSVRFKVCGLTRPDDAALAAELGADALGFILWPKSPRYLALADYAAFAGRLPRGPLRIAVMVEPTLSELDWTAEAGFDRFQIHARHDLPQSTVRSWHEVVGADRLWLAPKLPPEAAFPDHWLELANTFLTDTYHAAGYGGSGRVGDWSGFRARRAAHPDKTWILAGGLAPENLAAALAAGGADYVDWNSGVESAPGVKDAAKLRAAAAVLHARTAST